MSNKQLRIGIFGGTFNPPHNGHVHAAKAASDHLRLDKLMVVPAGMPPHKNLPEATATAEDRLHMACEAFSGIDAALIWSGEVFEPLPSYTIDTVKKISGIYPGAAMYLLVGTDMYLTLEVWKDSADLMNHVTPVVFARETGDLAPINRYSEQLQAKFNVKTEIVSAKPLTISSSQIRDMLPKRHGVGYMADTNYSYIIEHKLYGAKPNWDWLRDKARGMLKPARIPHTDGCEAVAKHLAGRWGADIEQACEAAILHDITKSNTVEENIEILEEHGCPAPETDRSAEKLLHAITGALVAKAKFGASEAVADAIRWHTTGKPDMSILEKVIYLADYIEPTRSFDGVEMLRELAYQDIDKAVAAGLELSIKEIEAKGLRVDPMTTTALEFILGRTIQ